MSGFDIKESVLGSLDEQRELFIWRFKDISREQVTTEYKHFKKHDLKNCGNLDEHEALMLLEHRDMAHTATELRVLLSEIDKDKDRRVNFLEWCCFFFKKDWLELNNFVDEESRANAIAEAMAAGERAKLAEAAIAEAKRLQEEKAKKKAAELEEEAKLTGVKGAAAFFKRAGESATGESTLSNKERITQEAARRKALREAKAAEEKAKSEASKVKSAEEIAAEVAAKALEVKADEERLEAEKIAKEKADRIARKKALNEKFNNRSAEN